MGNISATLVGPRLIVKNVFYSKAKPEIVFRLANRYNVCNFLFILMQHTVICTAFCVFLSEIVQNEARLFAYLPDQGIFKTQTKAKYTKLNDGLA